MTRETLTAYILDTYNAVWDTPWRDSPMSVVFRHPNNRKWFAVMMRVSRATLGLTGQETVDIVNLKGDPVLLGSLREEPGFLPAYHMNKQNWMTVLLDESASDALLTLLLDRSYEMTADKRAVKARPTSGGKKAWN